MGCHVTSSDDLNYISTEKLSYTIRSHVFTKNTYKNQYQIIQYNLSKRESTCFNESFDNDHIWLQFRIAYFVILETKFVQIKAPTY